MSSIELLEKRKNVNSWFFNIKVLNQIEDIKYLITWLVWRWNFEYSNLIDYKRKFLENRVISLEKIEKYLTNEQSRLLIQYKNELYESAIYWTPVDESKERKEELYIWEQLYFISKNIDNILKYSRK